MGGGIREEDEYKILGSKPRNWFPTDSRDTYSTAALHNSQIHYSRNLFNFYSQLTFYNFKMPFGVFHLAVTQLTLYGQMYDKILQVQ